MTKPTGLQFHLQTGAAWTDITPKVLYSRNVEFNRGRQDQFSTVQAGTMTATLDNTDGRFAPGQLGMAIDNGIRARFADPNSHNLATSPEDASFEGGTVGTWLAYAGKGSIANSATRAWDGTKSLAVTSSATGGWTYATVAGVTIGLTYTIQVRVWVPTGQPDVRLDLLGITVTPQTTSLKNQWVTLTLTFTVPVGYASETIQPIVAFDTVTVGQQIWIDGFQVWEGATAPPAFVTSPPQYVRKFKGYLSSIPVQWPGGQNYSEVLITAADRYATFARRVFRSVIEEEILSDSPSAYYTLAEAVKSTTAGDTSSNANPAMGVGTTGTGGSISFGSATGPATDSQTAVLFTRGSAVNGSFLSAMAPQPMFSAGIDACLLLEAFVLTGNVVEMGIAQADGGNLAGWVTALGVSATGKLTAIGYVAGTPVYSIVSAATVGDGKTHHVAVRETIAGGNLTADLFMDGALVATQTIATTRQDVRRLVAGGGLINSAFAGTLAHIAVTRAAATIPSARIAAHAQAGSDGFANERSDQRIARYARWVGIAAADQSLETGSLLTVDHLDTTQMLASAALEAIAVSEGGLVFVDRSGALAFQARAHRWNAVAFVTLGPDDISKDSQFLIDNQQLINQVTSSSPALANITVNDPASVAAHGVYPTTLQIVSTSLTDVANICQWAATAYSSPQPRANTISVDLLTSVQAISDAFKGVEIGATLAIAGLPVQAPASSLRLCVEGWREVIGTEEWSMAINTSSASANSAWVLEDPVYGVLDSTTRLGY